MTQTFSGIFWDGSFFVCWFPKFKKCRKLHFLEIAAPLCVGNNIWFAEHYNFFIRQLLCVLVSKLKYSDQRPPSRKYRSRWETQKKPQTYLENNKFYRRNYWPSKRMTASQYHTKLSIISNLSENNKFYWRNYWPSKSIWKNWNCYPFLTASFELRWKCEILKICKFSWSSFWNDLKDENVSWTK